MRNLRLQPVRSQSAAKLSRGQASGPGDARRCPGRRALPGRHRCAQAIGGAARGHHGPGGQDPRRPAPACSPPEVQTRPVLHPHSSGHADSGPCPGLDPGPWPLGAHTDKQEGPLPTEGSFRLLLASPSPRRCRPPHPPREGAHTALPCGCGAGREPQTPALRPSAASPRARRGRPALQAASTQEGPAAVLTQNS